MQLKPSFQVLKPLLQLASALNVSNKWAISGMRLAAKNTASLAFAKLAKTPFSEKGEHMSEVSRYQSVFPDFDYDYIALGEQLPKGWTDTTWHNNICPSYGFKFESPYVETWYSLWFDYKDPSLSEFYPHRITKNEKDKMHQFELTDEVGEYVYGSDDWNTMLKFINEGGVQNHYDNECERRATELNEQA